MFGAKYRLVRCHLKGLRCQLAPQDVPYFSPWATDWQKSNDDDDIDDEDDGVKQFSVGILKKILQNVGAQHST